MSHPSQSFKGTLFRIFCVTLLTNKPTNKGRGVNLSPLGGVSGALSEVTYSIALCLCSECLKKHLGPVWQLRYNQQGLSFAGEKVEELFSVSAEGRISRWFEFNTGLDCTGMCGQLQLVV